MACRKVAMLLVVWIQTINFNEWEIIHDLQMTGQTDLSKDGNDDGMNMMYGGRQQGCQCYRITYGQAVAP